MRALSSLSPGFFESRIKTFERARDWSHDYFSHYTYKEMVHWLLENRKQLMSELSLLKQKKELIMTIKKTLTVSSSDIRQVRMVAKLSVATAANLIGFSASALQKWEDGTRPMKPELFNIYVKEVQNYIDSMNPNFNTRPRTGSVWVHRKGGYEYTVVLVTSHPNKTQASQHPVQVVYESATTGDVWARGLVEFHQAFVEKPFKISAGGKAVARQPALKPSAKPIKKPVTSRKATKLAPTPSSSAWPFPQSDLQRPAIDPVPEMAKALVKSTSKKTVRR